MFKVEVLQCGYSGSILIVVEQQRQSSIIYYGQVEKNQIIFYDVYSEHKLQKTLNLGDGFFLKWVFCDINKRGQNIPMT